MYNKVKIKPPFFEMGPKAYIYGKKMLSFAKAVDQFAIKYNVQIILTPQYTDIPTIAKETSNLLIFAQHMDPISIGRGNGLVLPKALKEAGAVGVILNHIERPISLPELSKSIKRAKELELATLVCEGTIQEAAAIANLNPDIIVSEEPELIGTSQTSDEDYIKKVLEVIKSINPQIHVLQSAGIKSGKDVYNIVKAGAVATGSSSGIFASENPVAMAEEMVQAMRKAWDEFHI